MILRLILGGVIGAAAGFAYHKFVGCSTGACPLMSNPWVATIYGTILGLLVGASLK